MKQIISSNHRHRVALTLAAGLSIAAGSSLSLAQSQPAQHEHSGLSGSFDHPLAASAGHGSSNSTSTTMISESDGDDTFMVKIDGDAVSIEHNGKSVPKDRIRRHNDRIEILNKDGDVIKTINVSGVQPPTPPAAPRAARTPRPSQNTVAQPQEQAPPPVMVGMLMDMSDEAKGIVVQRVFEGMPAEKGGLKEDDVIVKIEGKGVEGFETLRDALKDKKAGDKLAITIERDGDSKELTLTLIKYDKEALAKARGEEADVTIDMGKADEPAPDAFGGKVMKWDWSDGKVKDEIVRAIEKAMGQVKHNNAGDADKWKGEVMRSLEEALAAVEKGSAELRGQLRAFGDAQGGNAAPTMIFRERPGQTFMLPPTPRTPDMTGQLDRLNQSLEKLNKRLDDMERKLNNK